VALIPCAGAEAHLIGKGGSNIRALEAKTGAHVRILNDTHQCEISGTPTQVKEAEELVKAHLARGGIENKRSARR